MYKDPVKEREYQKAYQKGYHKGYVDRNREKLREYERIYRKKYRLEHKDELREKTKGYTKKSRNKYPLKSRTRSITKELFKKGVIKKKPCEVCGYIKSEMHHPNYEDALNIVWLCRKHHGEVHRRYV